MNGQRTLGNGLIWLLPALLICGPWGRAQEPTLPVPRPLPNSSGAPGRPPPAALGLDELIGIGLEQNPNLRQAGFDIEAAQGRAVQAGLYPNPTVSVNGQEMGDPNGPGGFITAPFVSQEFVTAGKLRLSRAVAGREVDQASLGLLRQHFVLYTNVRQGYFEVLAAQRRVEILAELVDLATQTAETTRKLVEAKLVAELDLLQFRVELNRFRAEHDAARQERAAAWRRLAATLGVPHMPDAALTGSLEAAMPVYDFGPAQLVVLENYPDVRSAQVGVTRAQLALRRAQVEPIPNVTAGFGYTRDNVTRADEWTFEAGLPIPVFNRNQGNIQAAQAEVGRAIAEIRRVQNDLSNRLATAFGLYAAAGERVRRYRDQILPDARRLYQLALKAFQGGQFEYLRVLQAQRAVAEANLEYVRALGDQWRAASEIAGLLLEERWPLSIVGPCVALPAG